MYKTYQKGGSELLPGLDALGAHHWSYWIDQELTQLAQRTYDRSAEDKLWRRGDGTRTVKDKMISHGIVLFPCS